MDKNPFSVRSASSRLSLTLVLALVTASLALAASAGAAPPETGPFTISPSPVTLPTTSVGEVSPGVDFELTNGGVEVQVEGLSFTGGQAGTFTIAGSNCGNLFEGEKCSVGINFKPTAAGTAESLLVVKYGGGLEQAFPISAVGALPEFSLAPPEEDFGLIGAREERFTNFVVTNDGDAPIQVTGTPLSGSSAYSVNGPSNCFSGSLAPNGTCSIPVRFAPNSRGTFTGQLQVNASGTSVTANLEGKGGGPTFEPPVPAPDFGTATVGGGGVLRTISLSNTGDLPGSFFIAIVSGGDSASFELVEESCTGVAIAPGAGCSLKVRFAPNSAGPKSARLSLFGEEEGGGQIPLGGNGVAAAAGLTPGSLTFGPQAAGTRSAPLALAIRNDGVEPIETGQIAIVGADLDQFALAGDECTGQFIAVGAECAVRVRFAPDSAGAKTARLRIGIPGGALTADLSGTATAAVAPVPSSPAALAKKHHRRKHHRRKHHHHNRHHHHHPHRLHRGAESGPSQ